MHLHVVTLILAFTHRHHPLHISYKLTCFCIQARRKEKGGVLVQTVVSKSEYIVTYGKQVHKPFKLLMIQSCCICQIYQKIQYEKGKKPSFLYDLVEGRCSKRGMCHHICLNSPPWVIRTSNVGRQQTTSSVSEVGCQVKGKVIQKLFSFFRL